MRVPSRSRMTWEILSCCGGGRGEEGTAVARRASSLDSIIMVATASKLRCSLLLLLCRCGLAAAPSPWRICLTNAPWIKRYKKKPPAGDTCSSGPTECQFLLLCCRYGLLLCFPFQPTFFSCFGCCCFTWGPFSKLWDTLPFSCNWSLMCIDKAMIDKGQHCLPFSCPEFVQGLLDVDQDLASVLKLASNCITLKHRICGCTLHP